MEPDQSLTRQTLYEAVWSMPRSRLAVLWGVTAAQLTRLCREQEIPLPTAGYWTQAAFSTTPLRPALSGNPDLTVVMPAPKKRRTSRTKTTPLACFEPYERPADVIPPRKLKMAEALPLIRRAHRSYASPRCPRDDRHRYLSPAVEGIPVVHVFPETLQRALLLYDQLVRAFKTRRWRLRIGTGEDERKPTNWVQIGGREVAFLIREHLTAIEVKSRYSFQETERSYTGAGWLEIRTGRRYGAAFRDGKRQKLEDQVHDILEAFEEEIIKQERAERREKERLVLEGHRQELRRLVNEAIRRQQSCDDNLTDLMARRAQAAELRDFASEARARFALSGVLTRTQIEWLKWIEDKAASKDPFEALSQIDLSYPVSVEGFVAAKRREEPDRYAFLDTLCLSTEISDARFYCGSADWYRASRP
ncbi:hypothetical protein [Motiliproteus sediminis]|uniref:hypothetical protein n=1 Tax=Motiliproteus sediminis TaxID=1468178 RepID=UPI001AEFC4CC|nr:hypothetical protein [Motiliproteus sediminis]